MSMFFITYNLLNRVYVLQLNVSGGTEEWKKVHMLINPVYHELLLWFSIRHNRENSLVHFLRHDHY